MLLLLLSSERLTASASGVFDTVSTWERLVLVVFVDNDDPGAAAVAATAAAVPAADVFSCCGCGCCLPFRATNGDGGETPGTGVDAVAGAEMLSYMLAYGCSGGIQDWVRSGRKQAADARQMHGE